MLIHYLKFLFATDNLRQKYNQENNLIDEFEDSAIKTFFENKENISPGNQQHEKSLKEYNEKNKEIESSEDDTIIICFESEENINPCEERHEEGRISNLKSTIYKHVYEFLQRIGLKILLGYINVRYLLMMYNHPYMKDEFFNVLKYDETFKYLLFNKREEECSEFFASFNSFCDILEQEITKSYEKSQKLEELREKIEKIHQKITNERKLKIN